MLAQEEKTAAKHQLEKEKTAAKHQPKSAAERNQSFRPAANIQLPTTENLCGLKEKWRHRRPPSARIQNDAAHSSGGKECTQRAAEQPVGDMPSDGIVDLSKCKSSKSKTGYIGVYRHSTRHSTCIVVEPHSRVKTQDIDNEKFTTYKLFDTIISYGTQVTRFVHSFYYGRFNLLRR